MDGTTGNQKPPKIAAGEKPRTGDNILQRDATSPLLVNGDGGDGNPLRSESKLVPFALLAIGVSMVPAFYSAEISLT